MYATSCYKECRFSIPIPASVKITSIEVIKPALYNATAAPCHANGFYPVTLPDNDIFLPSILDNLFT